MTEAGPIAWTSRSQTSGVSEERGSGVAPMAWTASMKEF